MHTISIKFTSREAALAALKAADAGLVTTDKDGVDHFATASFDPTGARFDVMVNDVCEPTGKMFSPLPELPPMPETRVVGCQVDVYWQGDNPPTINGDKTAVNTYLSFDPPMPEEPVENSEPVSWMEFLALFSLDEQIEVATSNDPTVSLFRMMATGLGGDLNLKDPRVTMGLTALEKVGILKPNRKEQILNRIVPG